MMQTDAPLDSLIAALSPSARRRLARDITMQLRTAQSKRIAAQKNPDGSAFEARKTRLRQRRRLRMFNKLRTARYLRRHHSSSSASVGFEGRNSRIAENHQYGKTVYIGRGTHVRMPVRELLGFNKDTVAMVEDLVIQHLAAAI